MFCLFVFFFSGLYLCKTMFYLGSPKSLGQIFSPSAIAVYLVVSERDFGRGNIERAQAFFSSFFCPHIVQFVGTNLLIKESISFLNRLG